MKRLLVVVDMQNDFIDGALGTKEAQSIVPAVVKKAEAYAAAGDEVVFTLDTHFDDYMDTAEGRKLPVPHCIKGTPGWELCGQLKAFEGRRFEKHTFGSGSLSEYVRGGDYRSVELVGLCTDICVISNAVDPACCAGVSPESHDNAIAAMKVCQIDIL